MNKENKYYQPDISELHEGFEFETAIVDDGKVVDWCKRVYDIGIPYNTVKFMLLDNDYCRVKYLDREDIENCGFEYVTTSYDGYYKKGEVTLHVNYDKSISITVRINGMIDREVSCLTIKNVSELKILLKQLGVKHD